MYERRRARRAREGTNEFFTFQASSHFVHFLFGLIFFRSASLSILERECWGFWTSRFRLLFHRQLSLTFQYIGVQNCSAYFLVLRLFGGFFQRCRSSRAKPVGSLGDEFQTHFCVGLVHGPLSLGSGGRFCECAGDVGSSCFSTIWFRGEGIRIGGGR